MQKKASAASRGGSSTRGNYMGSYGGNGGVTFEDLYNAAEEKSSSKNSDKPKKKDKTKPKKKSSGKNNNKITWVWSKWK